MRDNGPSIVFIIIGIIMVIFHNPIGIGFCRFGKWQLRNLKNHPMYDRISSDILNVKKAPFMMIIMGLVYVILGIFFFVH